MPKYTFEIDISEKLFLDKMAFDIKDALFKGILKTDDGQTYRSYLVNEVVNIIKKDLDLSLIESDKQRIITSIREELEAEGRKRTKEYLNKLESDFKTAYAKAQQIIETELSKDSIKKIVSHLAGAQLGSKVKDVISKLLAE